MGKELGIIRSSRKVNKTRNISLLLTAVLSFGLAACTATPEPEPTNTPKPYPLESSVPLEKIPEWDVKNFAFPETWEQPVDDGTTKAIISAGTVYSRQKKGTCYFLGNILYLNPASRGEGDEFLTKKYIYESAPAGKAPELTETTIKSDGGPITFYQASGIEISAADPLPATAEGTLIARVLTPIESGTPVVSIVYACSTPEDFSSSDAKQFLNQLTLTIK